MMRSAVIAATLVVLAASPAYGAQKPHEHHHDRHHHRHDKNA